MQRLCQAPDAKQTTAEVSSCGTGAERFCANALCPSELTVSFSSGKAEILSWAILGHDTVQSAW
jgi:hypothetical protein